METEIEKTISTYNKTAKQYFQKTKDVSSCLKFLTMFSQLLPKESNVLDAGCGPGRDSKILSGMGFRVIGIDLSEKMIELARKYAPKATFKIMDFRKMDFDDNFFDGIWFNCSLLNVKKSDGEKTLREMNRVLKQKGLFYISVKEGQGEGFEKDERYNGLEKYWSYYREDELVRILKKTGFKIENKFKTGKVNNYYTHPIIRTFCRK